MQFKHFDTVIIHRYYYNKNKTNVLALIALLLTVLVIRVRYTHSRVYKLCLEAKYWCTPSQQHTQTHNQVLAPKLKTIT